MPGYVADFKIRGQETFSAEKFVRLTDTQNLSEVHQWLENRTKEEKNTLFALRTVTSGCRTDLIGQHLEVLIVV